MKITEHDLRKAILKKMVRSGNTITATKKIIINDSLEELVNRAKELGIEDDNDPFEVEIIIEPVEELIDPTIDYTFLLEKARILYAQSDYEESKLYFDQYLDTISINTFNSNYYEIDILNDQNLDKLCEIKEEYINLIIKYKNWDISEANSLIDKIDSEPIAMFKKMFRNEEMNDSDYQTLSQLPISFNGSDSSYKLAVKKKLVFDPNQILSELIRLDSLHVVDNLVFIYNKKVRREELYYEALEYNL